ncbi:uncharacterized protein CYBJADRAFT_165597 [Cyberlindnera jadinii NRRL Y-1542]|uniref:Uncharacterized protein n=1 Tax=Cyberlindnera jadinii (strain ATCC 18201 / CBS 1600 / BCRC 20928 / JCM 3617 / NBRC 0987 / NRRL Y-1542) TaxID=983966 RepID=A0A1E4SA69_CYBJN|nr:hypothetical protein CYBJADRAFT_165597 [Cyberlindnera jadinii NRRL Y-1542]ODV76292.1 hypothetical protein CYBJADRAFT_165597 [Cyberlindnera jadinii NRRL Y-1542]
MGSDGSKRRSLLFPFRSSKPESKFEVINRKKSPLAQHHPQAAVSTTIPSVPKQSISTIGSGKHVPVLTSSSAKPRISSAPEPKQRAPSPTSHHVLRPQSPHLPHLSPPHIHSPQLFARKSSESERDGYDSIQDIDIPRSSLDVMVDVPPVPDYNTKSFAPPLTIQGKPITMNKAASLPRRKPPSGFELHEPMMAHSSQESLSKVDSGLEAMAKPSVEIVNDPFRTVHSSNSKSLKEDTHPKENVSSFVSPNNEDEQKENFTHKTEPQLSESEDSESDFSFVNEDESLSGVFMPPSAPGLQLSRPASSSTADFYDAQDTVETSDVNIDSVTSDMNNVQLTGDESQQDSGNEGDQSSVEVKPLNFHRKTQSETLGIIPALITKSGEQTHKKQLSLSDEIMKDIENYQPGGVHYETDGDTEEEMSDVSPVTPLNKSNQLKEDIQLPTSLDQAVSGIQKTPSIDSPGPLRRRDSLFQDSSSEEIVLQRQNLLDDESSSDEEQNDKSFESNSSTAPQINYIPTNSSGLDYNEKSSSSKGLPRSDSLNDLNLITQQDVPFNLQKSNAPVIVPGDIYTQPLIESPHSSRAGSSVYPFESSEKLPLTTNNEDFISSDEKTNELSRQPITPEVNERPRVFHVVNDGNYSSSDEDSIVEPEGNSTADYSVVHQETFNLLNRSTTASSEVLSFTAKSPQMSHFNIDSPNNKSMGVGALHNNISDSNLSVGSSSMQPSISTPQQSIVSPPESASPMQSEYEPQPATNVYDRRANEVVAPVSYLSAGGQRRRRPPPPDIPTRSGRSASLTQPINTYNSVKEVAESRPVIQHEPQKSNYVEMLRLGTGIANTNAKASQWGLPIGISDNDYSKASWRTSYKRSSRVTKNDLKHGKIKQRQLALEVGDDDDDESLATAARGSSELKRNDTGHSIGANSTTTSIGGALVSPGSHSSMSFSPKRDSVPSVTRSGTLLNDKISPQISIGRSGTVRDGDKGHMTLFIANPDIQE